MTAATRRWVAKLRRPLRLSTVALPAPLPSWREGDAKRAIVDFVETVTDSTSARFVPASARIAVFDSDGTLWAEQPVPVQVFFALDRLRELAASHPEWKEHEPFKAALEGDATALAATGERGLLEIFAETHTGMSTEEFESIVWHWIESARHPTLGRPYPELAYQPMRELTDYLRARGFKTYVVSGAGSEFLRPWVEATYGIPPEQVIGSSVRVGYEMHDWSPVLMRLPEPDFVDDREGKPAAIHRFIGRRPLLAFGNSDGDRQMLRWTTAGTGARLAALLHHTDAEREWAYDRASRVGQLDAALPEASSKGWLVVDMARDWSCVYRSARSGAVA